MTKSHFNKFEKYRKDGIHSIEGWTVIPLCVEVGSRDHQPIMAADVRSSGPQKGSKQGTAQARDQHCSALQLLHMAESKVQRVVPPQTAAAISVTTPCNSMLRSFRLLTCGQPSSCGAVVSNEQ